MPPLIAFGIGLTLSVLVLRKDIHSVSNRLLALVLFSLSLWGIFIFLMRSSPNIEIALYWDKMAVPSGIAMFVFYYHFTSVYTNSKANKTIKLTYALLVSAIAVSASGLLIGRMSVESYGYAPIFLPTMYAISAGGAIVMIGALINLVRASRAATHHKYKTRLTYMIIAIIVLFSFGIMDIFPSLPPFGIFGNIIFGTLTGVAILRYHLLDINIALRRGLAYLSMSAIVAIPYVATFYYFQQVLNRNVPLGILIALLVFTAIVFNPLWQRIEGFVNRSFYQHRYDFLKALEQFIKESHDIRDIGHLGSSLVKLTSRALDASKIRLLLPNESGDFTTVSSSESADIPYSLSSNSHVVNWLRSNKDVLYYQDVVSLPPFSEISQRDLKVMEMIDIDIFVPLKDKGAELVGLLLLGKKASKKPYTYEDERLVLQVADRMGIELENAQLYEQIRRSEIALRESETLFRTIVESSPSFLMIVDTSGNVIYASPNCRQYTGYTQQELQGKITWWAHDDDLARTTEAFYSALREDTTSGENIEFKAIRRNGEQWLASASWRLLKDQQGESKSVVVQVTDITERRRMERERIEIQQKAYTSSRLASIGEMASGIAHEINNPLTSVIGFSQLLVERKIPEDIRNNIEMINKGAQRVADIVRRLLTFARQKKPKRGEVDVNALMEDTIALRRYELETNNIEININLDPNLPATMADANQLQQVFLNIIINAETEMKLASGKGRLFIKTRKDDGILKVIFRDDGPGISEENLERIFEPFFTTREIGQGTGLGLSLCHGIITEHGGRIYVDSTVGKGTTFTVELPIVSKTVQERSAKQIIAEHDNNIPKRTPDKILIVDDEISILQLLSSILVKEGYIVETVDNTKEALQRIKARTYGAILLDIKLPGMSGIDLYHKLEDTDKSLAKNVVFITGDTLDNSTRAFLSSEELSYMTKPFDEDLLKETIRRTLNDAK